jgi:hypothetical protein
MTIRNPVFLKRPWLWPVCTTIGASVVFLANGIGVLTKAAVFLGTITALNAFFFVALKRTPGGQDADPGPQTDPLSPTKNERNMGRETLATLAGFLLILGPIILSRKKNK